MAGSYKNVLLYVGLITAIGCDQELGLYTNILYIIAFAFIIQTEMSRVGVCIALKILTLL